jgi:hypothetical protein
VKPDLRVGNSSRALRIGRFTSRVHSGERETEDSASAILNSQEATLLDTLIWCKSQI